MGIPCNYTRPWWWDIAEGNDGEVGRRVVRFSEGQVDILLNDAKIRQQKRFARGCVAQTAIIEAEDFDPDYERIERAETNIERLFAGVVGCEGIVTQMKDTRSLPQT